MAGNFYSFENFKNIQQTINKKIKKALTDYQEPRSHITHRANAVYLEIRMPSIKKSNISFRINDKFIEIKAEYSQKKKQEELCGGYYRKITLPKDLDIKKCSHRFTRDTLKIKVPRKKIKKVK